MNWHVTSARDHGFERRLVTDGEGQAVLGLPVPATTPAARPTTDPSGCPLMLVTGAPTGSADRTSIAPIVTFEFRVRGDALLVYRRGTDDGFHRRSDPADHPVPDLLLVIEPGDRGPESNHVDDL